MKHSAEKRSGMLGKFIRLDEQGRQRARSQNTFDATKPSVLFWLTIAYAGIVFFLITGIPLPALDREPVPPGDLPAALTAAVVFYIVIVGGLYLRDRLKK